MLTNPQFARMHGYEGGELIGRHFDILRVSNLDQTELEIRSKVEGELLRESTSSYENRALLQGRPPDLVSDQRVADAAPRLRPGPQPGQERHHR